MKTTYITLKLKLAARGFAALVPSALSKTLFGILSFLYVFRVSVTAFETKKYTMISSDNFY